MVARNQRIEEAPVPQVADALLVETALPVGCLASGRRCGRAPGHQRCPGPYQRRAERVPSSQPHPHPSVDPFVLPQSQASPNDTGFSS